MVVNGTSSPLGETALSEPRPLPHAMSALPDAAEQARLDFAVAFKHLLGHPIKSALPHIYRERAEPAWAAQHGRAPESWQEVGEALSDTSAYRWWRDRTSTRLNSSN